MNTLAAAFPRASLIGFDHLFNELENLSLYTNDRYPPHNIIKADDNHYTIELALAGFNDDELSIEVKDKTLTVKGEHTSNNRDYIHRGISTKKFARAFRLAENVEAIGAEFKNGILSIALEYEVPEELRTRKIPIGHDKSTSTEKQFLTESGESKNKLSGLWNKTNKEKEYVK